MAPAVDSNDNQRLWERFPAAEAPGTFTLPPWATGDDADDEDGQVKPRASRGRWRRRHLRLKRAEAGTMPIQTQSNLPPSPASPSEDSGVDSPDTGEEGDSTDEDETGDPGPPAGPPSVSAAPTDAPTVTAGMPGPDASPDAPPDAGDDSVSVTLPTPVTDSGPSTGSSPGESAPTEDPASSIGPLPDQRPTSTSYGPTTTLEPTEDPELPDSPSPAETQATQRHHKNVEIALSVVVFFVAVALVVLTVWLVRRARRRRRARDNPTEPPPRKPGLKARLLATIPVFRSRDVDSTWSTLDGPISDDRGEYDDEKEKVPQSIGTDGPPPTYAPLQLHAAVGTAIPKITVAPPQSDRGSNNGPPQRWPPPSPTGSSLSSGFGNGTFIPPTPAYPSPALHARNDDEDVGLPSPSTRRDTLYTQSSGRSAPRFRTVNSWVRQQAGHLGKGSTREVPEQGYGLMMDDEEPRRVVINPKDVGVAS